VDAFINLSSWSHNLFDLIDERKSGVDLRSTRTPPDSDPKRKSPRGNWVISHVVTMLEASHILVSMGMTFVSLWSMKRFIILYRW
jgi:hypothetical protein